MRKEGEKPPFDKPVEFRVHKDFIDPYNHLYHVAWDYYLAQARHLSAVVMPPKALNRAVIEYKRELKEGNNMNISTGFREENGETYFYQEVNHLGNIVGVAKTSYGKPATGLTVIENPNLRDSVAEVDDDFFKLKGRHMGQFAAATYFETERIRGFKARVLNTETLAEKGLAIMARSVDIQFAEDIKPGQTVNVRSQVDVEGIRINFRQQIVGGENVLCEGNIIYIPVDISGEEPRIIRPPKELIDMLTGKPKYDIPDSPDDRWLK